MNIVNQYLSVESIFFLKNVVQHMPISENIVKDSFIFCVIFLGRN
jgi:hypothetical protein